MKRCLHLLRGQSGSQGLGAAGAALAAALIIAALLGGADVVAPAVDRAFSCAAVVLGGGGAGCASGGAPSGGESDAGDGRSWWDRFWDGVKDGWNWFFENVLAPVGNFFKDAWEWLSKEREWTWWRDALNWLKEQGPLGIFAAGLLGFLGDLLFGIGADGKFRWGLVAFATITTILSFFGVGLLAKIPVIGKLFAGGGALARFGAWIKGLPWVQKLINSAFGKWIAKLNANGIADLLQGKFGTWLVNLGRALGKVPILGPILLAIKDSKLIKTLGNYVWTYLKRGPAGLVGDVIGTIIKDILNPKPGSRTEKFVKIFTRLGIWSGVRNIIKWLLNPTFPF
jgi:hypothetical protein